jgi:hypothetical protein
MTEVMNSVEVLKEVGGDGIKLEAKCRLSIKRHRALFCLSMELGTFHLELQP